MQNNFFITNLMEVLQRDPECSRPDDCNVLESASAATACQPLSCPNHEGKVSKKKPNKKSCHRFTTVSWRFLEWKPLLEGPFFERKDSH